MSKLARLLVFIKRLPVWLQISGKSGYLERTGWIESNVQRVAIDAHGEAIPWITYPSLAFLEERVRPYMKVFEYGSGSSTLWWARRVRWVRSCEHDKSWFEHTRARVPDNVEITLVDLRGGEYAREILKYRDTFDVVVIDGGDRVSCARNAVTALKSNGVILWDNSDRAEYESGYSFLEGCGFRRIEFKGMGPINAYGWSTTVFYRDDNCFAI